MAPSNQSKPTTVGPVTAENVSADTTKNQAPAVIEGVNLGATSEAKPGETANGEAQKDPPAPEVLPQATIDALNAQADKVAEETGAEVIEVPGVGDPPAAAPVHGRDFAQEQPRHLHPLNRLRRVQSVLDSILEHMSMSSHSPISREDVAELREYLKNGNGEAEEDDDEDDD